MAIQAVGNLADQVQDYTIDPTGSSAGGTDVPQSHVIAGTVPILIDGAASADMTTSPTTISVLPFTATEPGVVPLSGGGTINFLRADGTWTVAPTFVGTTAGLVPGGSGASAAVFLSGAGTWVAGAVAGVSSITANAAIAASAATGAITLSSLAATLTAPGHVPAVGAVDATQALIRTNPPTWGTVGLTGFIQLQATYPGTAQTGHGHITGVFGAQNAIVAGSDKKGYNGTGLENLYVKQSGAVNHPVVAAYSALGGTISPGMIFRASRGTEAVPVDVAADDVCTRLVTERRDGGAWNQREFLTIGAKSSGAYNLTLQSYSSTVQSAYLHLTANALAGLNTLTPKSGFEIGTSLGLKSETKSSSFDAGDASTHFLLDCSGGQVRATLPLASGRAGRVYAFTKVDGGFFSAFVRGDPGAGDLIDGMGEKWLTSLGHSLVLISDDDNWWSVSSNLDGIQAANQSDGSAVGASSTSEVIIAQFDLHNIEKVGASFGFKMRGTQSSNGTPLMTFLVRETGLAGTIMASFASQNSASGATDFPWEMDAEWVVRTSAAGTGTGGIVRSNLKHSATSGLYSEYTGAIIVPAGSFSTDGTLTLVVTGQFGTSHANNNFRMRNWNAWVKQANGIGF